MSQTPLIALAERLYRILLLFYPTPYRHEYGALMVQVFRDVSRASYRSHGLVGLAGWWYATLFDLIRTVIEQRRESAISRPTFIRPKTAAVISLLLCLPISYVLLSAIFHIKLPLIYQLEQIMYDEYRPTSIGTSIMFGMLFALPAAFLINLLSMVAKAGSDSRTPFKPTRTHSIVGMSSLCFVQLILARQVLYELKPFVTPLGSGAVFGQILFLLGLLVVPSAFLLNRLPRFATTGLGGRLTFQPTSINLIIGAVILLVILMFVSTFMLETLACSSGVPNCD